MKKNKQSEYDMTFNSPMAVSLLMTVATDQEREAIVSAHNRYVGTVVRDGIDIRDGMGAMVEDVRPLIDIIIEPGAKFAPSEGLTSEQVQSVFALCEGTPTHLFGEGGKANP